MDVKYSYYNTSKGYRVVGGTAAHFLKADGGLDNTTYATVNQSDAKYVPYTGATSDLTLADKNLNLTTGSLSKFENGLRVFNKVFHKTYSNAAQIGIISFKFPQATTSATMFTVDINYHEYNSRSLGKLRVAFYKQTATILHTSGRAALWEGTDNLPSTIINVGIDLAGNVCINLGEITTNWGTYAHFEIERVQTSYTGLNADWSKGWSQTTETVAPIVPDTYQSLVNIVPEIVATRTFMDTTLIGSIPKSSLSLGTADLNTVVTAGFYQQITTSLATITNNYPVTIIGYLNVYRVNTTRVVQEYTEFTNLTTYKRSYNGTTWTSWIESGITTTTNQTALSGNKTTSGVWNFSGTNASAITIQRLGNTSNNSIAFGFDTPSMYAGMADAGNFAIGSNANLLSTPNRKFWIDFAANSVNAPGQIGGSTLTSKDLGGFTINTTTNTSKAEMILRHVWSANNQTFGVGGISSATSGSMSQWGMYKWLNDRTVNGNDGFFGWEGDTDTLKASSLVGTGTRMVVADSVGRLNTQIIPSVPTSTQINNWNTAFNWGNHANVGYATTAQLGSYIPLSQKGSANGVATLDASGLIPSTQLPSYVDDVIEAPSLAALNALPAGEKQTGKIYVTTDTNKSYRWSGTVFVEISSGAVQSVNGQTGVVNLTYSDVGASAVNHIHTIAGVTGLQSALDGKVDDSQVLTNVPAGALFTDTIYTLPTATSTNKGGVEIFSDTVQTVASNSVTATASRTYGIQLNSAGQAVVNVPWVDTNTSYTAGNGLTLTGTAFSLPVTVSGSGNYITDVAQNANGITVTKGSLPSYSLTVATSTSLGGIRLFSDVVNSMAPNSVTEIKGRSYAVQLNNNNQAIVNVPWTDNNTTYTSSNGIVLTGTNFTPTYGITVNTFAQGNDSRINNGETAFNWGNHANAGYLTNSALFNYYTKNESLNLFVKSSGVETISDTKTFTHSPVIPNGTLGAHAVNKSQIELSTNPETEGGQQLYISGNNSVNLTNYFVTSRDGSRNPDDIAPNSTPRRVRFDFANSTSAGLGGSGNYAGIMTFAPWDGTTASTGDSSYQLAFANQSGSNGAGAPMLKLRKGIDGKWGKWSKLWTDADFTNINIQQWNYAYQYGLKLNEEFSINTGSRLMLADGFYGNESGIMDHTFERFVSGKQNEYYKYGSLYGNFDGLNFNLDTKLFGMGRESNKDDKLTVDGSVKASKNFKSEDENPHTIFIPNGNTATLRDEIVNDESDYAIRLDPHEYEIDPSGFLGVDDRNRLIHIIGEQVKMTVDFKRIYPKQQIVIYNFDQSGGTMAVKIQGKLIANLSARCFLRLYVTKSLRVIAERQQPCDFVW